MDRVEVPDADERFRSAVMPSDGGERWAHDSLAGHDVPVGCEAPEKVPSPLSHSDAMELIRPVGLGGCTR